MSHADHFTNEHTTMSIKPETMTPQEMKDFKESFLVYSDKPLFCIQNTKFHFDVHRPAIIKLDVYDDEEYEYLNEEHRWSPGFCSCPHCAGTDTSGECLELGFKAYIFDDDALTHLTTEDIMRIADQPELARYIRHGNMVIDCDVVTDGHSVHRVIPRGDPAIRELYNSATVMENFARYENTLYKL